MILVIILTTVNPFFTHRDLPDGSTVYGWLIKIQGSKESDSNESVKTHAGLLSTRPR